MAINRAALPQQLQAGAPDLRLTGDQTHRGTYTQRRRNQMAGGGITNARQGYGLGSLVQGLKDKFVEDIIPNEIKNPAALATLAGIGLNQWGLPDIPGMGAIGLEKGMGQNWMGDLLGGVIPGDTQFNTVFGDDRSFLGNYTGAFPDQIGDWTPGAGNVDPFGITGQEGVWYPGIGNAPIGNLQAAKDFATQKLTNYVKQKTGLDTVKGLRDTLFGDTTRGGQAFNWKIPVAGGLAAGAYTAAQPRDTLPMDQTGINFQTAQQAMDDPNLRFKPPLEATQLAADGGRIGYRIGKGVQTEKGSIKGQRAGPEWFQIRVEQLMEEGYSEAEASSIAWDEGHGGAAQGGRIGYQEAGPVLSKEEIITIKHMNEMGSDISTISSITGATPDQINNVLNPVPKEPVTEEPVPEEEKGSMWNPLNWFAQGGRIGYDNGGILDEQEPRYTDPLYIDPTTNLPLHKIEKKFQRMNEEERKKAYEDMLRRIESFRWIDEDKSKYGKRYKDMLHFGARGDGGSGASKLTEALVYTNHPAAEALYERGEHYNRGGRIGLKKGKQPKPGSHEYLMQWLHRKGAQEGGLMNLGGMEKDYRQEGGFVPIGGEEKADDVPARLSKNEFVFTADAVRAAGGGDIDQGAAVMENLMENLEAGGEVSEESQGLEGAREMFANAQELEKRII